IDATNSSILIHQHNAIAHPIRPHAIERAIGPLDAVRSQARSVLGGKPEHGLDFRVRTDRAAVKIFGARSCRRFILHPR
ncbi:hypothetical protein NVV43_30710, partial [Escherichia marmotae]|nr:hypothetical protein [Escherichia marmotae]